jgi:hypothetical protein
VQPVTPDVDEPAGRSEAPAMPFGADLLIENAQRQ